MIIIIFIVNNLINIHLKLNIIKKGNEIKLKIINKNLILILLLIILLLLI